MHNRAFKTDLNGMSYLYNLFLLSRVEVAIKWQPKWKIKKMVFICTWVKLLYTRQSIQH